MFTEDDDIELKSLMLSPLEREHMNSDLNNYKKKINNVMAEARKAAKGKNACIATMTKVVFVILILSLLSA